MGKRRRGIPGLTAGAALATIKLGRNDEAARAAANRLARAPDKLEIGRAGALEGVAPLFDTFPRAAATLVKHLLYSESKMMDNLDPNRELAYEAGIMQKIVPLLNVQTKKGDVSLFIDALDGMLQIQNGRRRHFANCALKSGILPKLKALMDGTSSSMHAVCYTILLLSNRLQDPSPMFESGLVDGIGRFVATKAAHSPGGVQAMATLVSLAAKGGPTRYQLRAKLKDCGRALQQIHAEAQSKAKKGYPKQLARAAIKLQSFLADDDDAEDKYN
eukprot:587995-Prymnesium_polylepis.1